MMLKKTYLAVVVAMAFAIALAIMATTMTGEEKPTVTIPEPLSTSADDDDDQGQSAVPLKRVSRFLVQDDPRPKFHCNKDDDVCHEDGSPGSTCCNNKCIDVMTDDKHCGACKGLNKKGKSSKCKFTETCCNGECVNLNFDKRHCGKCGTKCMQGGYCIYGMCDYA